MIDWDRIEELRYEIGDEDFVEVGRIFLAEIEEKLRDMEGNSNLDAADFHFLCGSAANLGFVELTALCRSAEGQAHGGKPVDLVAIRNCFDQSMADIRGLFDG